MDAVLQAIHTLYSPSTTAAASVTALGGAASVSHADAGKARQEADEWLKNFRKTSEAWGIADSLIRMDGVQLETQIFAAQTLREKVRHDLDQIPPTSRLPLRDTLLSALLRFRHGPRSITWPLSTALARLAILLPQWERPLQQLFVMFSEGAGGGGGGGDMGLLLNFVGELVDEFERGGRGVDVEREEHTARRTSLVTDNANDVLHMLLTIINSDMDEDLQKQAYDCLYTWLRSGDIPITKLSSTQLVERAFAALHSDTTFDAAENVIVEVIVQTGRELRLSRGGGGIGVNGVGAMDPALYMPVVMSVYQCLMPLLPIVQKAAAAASSSTATTAASAASEEDEEILEKLSGLCNIYSYAGENYLPLILDNLDAWRGIVDGLLACAASSDVEICAITFNFWSLLGEDITAAERKEVLLPSFLDLYRYLIDILMVHLHYPMDMSWTAKERDEFSDFRHNMGDVLKVCVDVLGAEEALLRPYKLLTGFVVTGAGPDGALDPSVPWQKIEAPLFALRTMGKKVSDSEGKMLPDIMEMLPKLPAHPKVRYAAILVIGRYASWTRLHPEFIPYQMTFIAKGFEDAESIAAACQALKYLCEECGQMMVDYLSQLHPFYMKIVGSISRYERLDLVKALALVIRHVPVVVAPNSDSLGLLKVLEMFCLPIAQRLHEIGSSGKGTAAALDKAIVGEACDLMEQFSNFVYHCSPLQLPLGAANPCMVLFQSMWPVFSALLDLGNSSITVNVCKIINDMLTVHAEHFHPAIQEVLGKMVTSYAETEVSPLLWGACKVLRRYGSDKSPDGVIMRQLVEAMSTTAFKCIQAAASIDAASDIIEDYFSLLSAFVECCPIQFLHSQLLPTFIQCAIACMPVYQVHAWVCLYIDFLKPMLVLASPHRKTPIPEPIVAPLVETIRAQCANLLTVYFKGLVSTFPHQDDLREERDRHIFGSLLVLIWDVVLADIQSAAAVAAAAGGSTALPLNGSTTAAAAVGGGIAGLVGGAAASTEDLMRMMSSVVDEVSQNAPIFSSDADKVAFLTNLMREASMRENVKVDRLLKDFVIKYKRSDHRRVKK